MISFKQLLEKAAAINWKTWIWIGLGLAALPALHIYYVQEMIAALIVFALVFAAVFVGALAIFLLIRALIRANRPIVAWAVPNAGRLVQWGADAVDGIASPAWARVRQHRFRRERLKFNDVHLNEKYKIIYSRFAGLRPRHIYRVGLQVGGAALTIGRSTQKRMSNRLGSWLTQRVGYSDLIRFASRSQVRPYVRRYRRAAR